MLQKRMYGILARKQVDKMRNDEMEFLGMKRKKKTPEELINDPIRKMTATQQERKKIQQGNMKSYGHNKQLVKEEIDEN